MAFHETVLTDLKDAGANRDELTNLDLVVTELGTAIGACDARRMLAAFTRVNKEMDFVLERPPEGSKNDILQIPHVRIFRKYVGLKVGLYKELEAGMKGCDGRWVESSFVLPDTEGFTDEEAATVLESFTAAESPPPAAAESPPPAAAPTTTTSRQTGVTKPKRAPSDYNIFIGECLRKPDNVRPGRGKDMTFCSDDWKSLKDQPEEKARRVADIKRRLG